MARHLGISFAWSSAERIIGVAWAYFADLHSLPAFSNRICTSLGSGEPVQSVRAGAPWGLASVEARRTAVSKTARLVIFPSLVSVANNILAGVMALRW